MATGYDYIKAHNYYMRHRQLKGGRSSKNVKGAKPKTVSGTMKSTIKSSLGTGKSIAEFKGSTLQTVSSSIGKSKSKATKQVKEISAKISSMSKDQKMKAAPSIKKALESVKKLTADRKQTVSAKVSTTARPTGMSMREAMSSRGQTKTVSAKIRR